LDSDPPLCRRLPLELGLELDFVFLIAMKVACVGRVKVNAIAERGIGLASICRAGRLGDREAVPP
jgi:hypothetical protein